MTTLNALMPKSLLSCLGVNRSQRDVLNQDENPSGARALSMNMDIKGPLAEVIQGATNSRRKILETSELKDHFDRLADGQSPKYYVIACSDSRVSPPEVFHAKPGTMFEMQQLGALMPATQELPLQKNSSIDSEWANVSYAVRELKVQHLIILGHTGCGAVAGIMAPEAIAHNPEVANHLAKHAALKERVEARFAHLEGKEKGLAAVGESVLQTMEKVAAFAPVKEAMDNKRLQLHGMVYEIANHGAVSVWDAGLKEFVIKNPVNSGDRSILPRRAR